MENSLNSITELGFEKVGEWVLKNGKIEAVLNEDKRAQENFIYAFVVNEKVMYIGKTSRTLKARMQNYTNCDESQTANVRICEEVKNILKNSGEVLIYAMPNGDLEPKFIKMLSPEWNIQGVENE
ncbi:MAG: hypothetical protein FWE23_11260 [Chitinivibrionia bacterium]|nr:hypothetical protein [Chitinivibrionia bacterium]